MWFSEGLWRPPVTVHGQRTRLPCPFAGCDFYLMHEGPCPDNMSQHIMRVHQRVKHDH